MTPLKVRTKAESPVGGYFLVGDSLEADFSIIRDVL